MISLLTYVALAAAVCVLLCLVRKRGWRSFFVAAPPLTDHPSANFNDRPAGARVVHLILHYTAMNSAQEALDKLCTAGTGVSSHYLVGADGTIWRLVGEDKRAWHAGVSFWRGARDLNSTSIGIEIDNPGNRPFTAVQMESVRRLCAWIIARHGIKPQNVIAHSDIAPDRKPDPGFFFDWRGLAAAGIGVWPAPTSQDYVTSDSWKEKEVRAALTQYGYATNVTFAQAQEAFQRHFHQEVAGTNDVGKVLKESSARLAWLVRNKA